VLSRRCNAIWQAASMSQFEKSTECRPVGAGRFEVELDPNWSIASKPHGGYLLAILARAALAVSDKPHPLAVSAHYLSSPSGGPAQVTATVLRSGRTVTAVRASLDQDGKPVIESLISTGELADTEEAPFHLSGPPLTLPPVEDCLPATGVTPTGHKVGLQDFVDLRFDPATVQWVSGKGTGRAEIQAWVQLKDGSPNDPLFALLALDALPPVTFDLGVFGWVPTVELTAYLRRMPAQGWLAARMTGRLIDGGWIDEDTELWDADGHLVAQARQFAGVRLPQT
jgi:acyl-CoA thioesterase